MKRAILRHFATIGVIGIFSIMSIGSTDEKETQQSIANIEPSYEVTAKKLYDEYEANGVAADQKYKDKVIRVTGIVNTIDRDITNTIYVTLRGANYFGDVQCFFSDDYANAAAQLKKGQKITVKGKCSGKMMNVLVKGCIIEK